MPKQEVIGPLPHQRRGRGHPIRTQLSGNSALEIIAVFIDGKKWTPGTIPDCWM